LSTCIASLYTGPADSSWHQPSSFTGDAAAADH